MITASFFKRLEPLEETEVYRRVKILLGMAMGFIAFRLADFIQPTPVLSWVVVLIGYFLMYRLYYYHVAMYIRETRQPGDFEADIRYCPETTSRFWLRTTLILCGVATWVALVFLFMFSAQWSEPGTAMFFIANAIFVPGILSVADHSIFMITLLVYIKPTPPKDPSTPSDNSSDFIPVSIVPIVL